MKTSQRPPSATGMQPLFPARAAAGRRLVAALALCTALAACDGQTGHYNPQPNEPAPAGTTATGGGIFGPGGLNLFGGGRPAEAEAGNGIGVNSFLWRASLDTISFMPLAQADPFGGVITTDYYSPPDTPDQRLKVSVFIFDRKLTANAIKASVFRQEKGTDGRWTDAPVDPSTATKLENAILTRARELRVTTAQAQ